MQKMHQNVQVFFDMAKIQTIMGRRFDASLGGIGWSEFMILYQLSIAEGARLRRIDLADRIGLTASGVTRLLLPMEKIGLVKKEVNKEDARSSLVLLAPGGRQKLEEALERAELLVGDIIQPSDRATMRSLSESLAALGQRIR